MKNPIRLISKGIRSPGDTPAYIKELGTWLKHKYQYKNTLKQKKAIHEFVTKQKFIIVILDSCRFDYFNEEIDSYVAGDLKMAYTPATATIQYIQTIWDGQYDLTYITGMPAPTNYAFKRKGLEYRPEEHFSEFVHVWQSCNSKELGAVPPEVMTEAAFENDSDRKVVHYVQPHAPYIGNERLRDTEDDTSWGESLEDIYTKIGRYDISQKEIPDESLKKAYRSNLCRVLNSVEELVSRVDVPVVITGDHGEFLGESDRYIHGGPRHPILCEVPWFLVDDAELGTKDGHSESGEYNEADYEPREVENQLEQLGYL
jgi:hypothetical protein